MSKHLDPFGVETAMSRIHWGAEPHITRDYRTVTLDEQDCRDVLAALQSEKARAELYKEADESMQEEVGRLHALLYDEKARADAADSRIAALEAGMRDAEAKMRAWGDKEAGPAYAGRYYNCADELSALLNRPADGGE